MIIDGIVIAVLLASALISFFRGFIREVLTILGVVGGLIAAYIGGPLLQPLMRGWMGVAEGAEPERFMGIVPYSIIADGASYGAIFIVVVIVLSVASHFLSESAKSIGLGAVDRSMGVAFGLARGALLVGIAYLPLYFSLERQARQELSWIKESRSAMYLEAVAGGIAGLLPGEKMEELKKTAGQLQGQADNARQKLEAIDVLKDGAQNLEEKLRDKPAGEEGYTPEFRKEMDKLFENGDKPAEIQPAPATGQSDKDGEQQ